MRTLAGLTLYFSAILLTVGFESRGESLEPSGEYAVIATPFERQYSTSSSWTQDLDNTTAVSDLPESHTSKKHSVTYG